MIGSNLVRTLLAHPDQPAVFVADDFSRGRRENLRDRGELILPAPHLHEVDLRDPPNCLRAAAGMDEVYHLADVVGGIEFVLGNQVRIFRDNLAIDTNMLAAAAEAGVRRFLYVGTACSYPHEKQMNPDAPPLKEADALPANPESAYGWSKLMGEYATLLHGRETAMATGVLRLHNVYGLPADFSPERSQIIPALVRKAACFPAERFVAWGSGAQARDFVHVDDVVRGMLTMMERGLGPDVIQLGSQQATTVQEIAEIVVRVSGKPIRIEYDTGKPEGDRVRRADTARARAVLGWEAHVELSDGIRRMYDHFSQLGK